MEDQPTKPTNKGYKQRRTALRDAAVGASPKQILHLVFEHIDTFTYPKTVGGFEAFGKWAHANPEKFYVMFFKTAPGSKPNDVRRGGTPRETAEDVFKTKVRIRKFGKGGNGEA